MSAQAWRTARWFVAIGLCALVVFVALPMAFDALSNSLVFGESVDPDDPDVEEPAEDDQDAPTGEVPSGPVDDGSSTPTADFIVQDGTVRASTSESLALTALGEAVVALFPLVEGNPDCVALAELEMEVVEAQPTHIAIYASSVHTPPDNGAEVGNPRRDGATRAIAVTDGTPGRLRWDVTDVYRAWANAELAPAGTPFALAVVPRDEPVRVIFTSAEAGADRAPTLMWQARPDCGG